MSFPPIIDDKSDFVKKLNLLMQIK